MIMIIFKRNGLIGWEKKRYGEILKRLIPELRRFNEVIGIFGDDVDAAIQLRFK